MSGAAHSPPSGGGADVRPMLERCEVLGNDRLAEGIGLLMLRSPHVASNAEPGQFVHLRIAEGADFILRRPFSVHRTDGDRVELLYRVLGVGTRAMSMRARGDVMDLIGPLGNGFQVPSDVTRALLVAGGLGAAPLGMLAEDLARRGVAVSVALGAPTAERLVARALFESVARRVVISTDDGTAGEHGVVTGLVEELLVADRPDIVCACGPEPMSRVVATQAKAAEIPCRVSLERLMACGVGACLSCVVSTVAGPKRACADGPVFNAEEVLWDASETPTRL